MASDCWTDELQAFEWGVADWVGSCAQINELDTVTFLYLRPCGGFALHNTVHHRLQWHAQQRNMHVHIEHVFG